MNESAVRGSRDLLVSPPTPMLGTGPAQRTAGLVRALLRLGPLDLLYEPSEDEQPDPWFLAQEGLALHRAEAKGGLRRSLGYARQRMVGIPAGIARDASPALRATAERLAAAPGRGRVIADGPVAGAALLRLAGHRPVVYHAHGVQSASRDAQNAELAHRRELRSFERGLFKTAAESWVASARDLRAAEDLAPYARLRLVPAVIDVDAIEPVALAEVRDDVLLLGDFTEASDAAGLRFLAEEVMPAVWLAQPSATLTVAGPGADTMDVAQDDARLRRLGEVEDAGELFRRAGCAAFPVLEGPGSPRRVLEALARGVPVVATPRAVRGLDLAAAFHYFRARPDRTEFAIALVEALKGLSGPQVAAAGRHRVIARHSIDALAEVLRPDAPV